MYAESRGIQPGLSACYILPRWPIKKKLLTRQIDANTETRHQQPRNEETEFYISAFSIICIIYGAPGNVVKREPH